MDYSAIVTVATDDSAPLAFAVLAVLGLFAGVLVSYVGARYLLDAVSGDGFADDIDRREVADRQFHEEFDAVMDLWDEER